jgi:hypothetical protein
MMKVLVRIAPVLISTSFLFAAGCGGAGHAGAVPSQKQTLSKTANLTFTIVIPKANGTNAAKRAPTFISSSTKSATITVTPAAGSAQTQTVNCTTTCQASFVAVVGSATISASLFDATNGTGTQLSTGSLATTIVAAQANVVTVTFNPIVGQVRASAGTLLTGTSGSTTITITVLDPDGNIIMGPGAFTDTSGNPDPIALSSSDTSGHTSLSTSSYTTASSPMPTLSYDGTPLHGMYPTITLSNTVGPPISLPLQIVPTVAWTRPTAYAARSFTLGLGGTVWFSEDGIDNNGNVQGEVGSVSPGGLVTEYSIGSHYFRSVALGSDGNIWGAVTDNLSASLPGSMLRITPAGTMTNFPIPFPPANNYQQNHAVFNVVSGADGNLWWFTTPRGGPSTVGFYSTDTSGNMLKSGYFPNEPGGTYLVELAGAAAASNGAWANFGPQESLGYNIRVNLDGTLSNAVAYPSLNGTVLGFLPILQDVITSSDNSVWETASSYVCTGGGCTYSGSYLINTTSGGTTSAYMISPAYLTSGGLAEGLDHRLWFILGGINQDGVTTYELEAMTKTGTISDTGLAIPNGAERMLATPDGSLYISVFCPSSICTNSTTAVEKVVY